MKFLSGKRARLKRVILASSLLLVALALSGCRTVSFYAQAARGQLKILTSQEPVTSLLKDSSTDPQLKQRLELVLQLRTFAEEKLGLPVDDHYKKYADLHRPFVVWNVQAAPEFSLEPKTWWYPMLGSLDYRGYFSKKGATNYANWLHQKKGYDIFVGGVVAYSTLGWFKDPVLNTFVFDPDNFLAELLFHELGHQAVFARGDTDFNEAFATTVGQEGTRRWLQQAPEKQRAEYETYLRHNSEFVALIARTREKLQQVYGDVRDEEGKVRSTDRNKFTPPEQLRLEKRRILEETRKEYDALKKSWGGETSHDFWFSREINNAQLNSVATYYDLVPGFEQLLILNHGDLPRFYAEASRLAKMPRDQRHSWLETLAKIRKATVGSS